MPKPSTGSKLALVGILSLLLLFILSKPHMTQRRCSSLPRPLFPFQGMPEEQLPCSRSLQSLLSFSSSIAVPLAWAGFLSVISSLITRQERRHGLLYPSCEPAALPHFHNTLICLPSSCFNPSSFVIAALRLLDSCPLVVRSESQHQH
ncbi:uncharacterized protein BDR25DRAFT_19106 [Lindgomyces ingoldianus]|uniref:Uncharacterized protein n=1 Tax=Lindgomyces ingoldianus TaxID=673940 RepID=A0ACB6QZC1_9PLEO|nr:uncharacterized protein BDR25DRAFT_19106 [Lindgomyces ingoldianus]KAF2472185.1 hypothetical protein BDR25DRAFT_19106 [Lindgomyces ingoldianus]